MKVTLEGLAFRDAIKTAAILFDAEIEVLVTAQEGENVLVLEAGRNGVYLRQNIEAEVEEEGSIVLSCAHFASLALQSRLHMASDGKQITFECGKFRGTVIGSADSSNIEAQRPEKMFKASTVIPTEIFRSAVGRVAFGQALPGAQAGIRIQVGDMLTVSTTDQYRATLYKETLAVKQEEFDVLLQPTFLNTILSRVAAAEVRIGANKGTFRLKAAGLDVFHPAIQSTPEDIEEWINNGIDHAKKAATVSAKAEEVAEALREVSSIHMGALAYDTHVDCMVKGLKMHLRCTADHGSTTTSVDLSESDTQKFLTKLSTKYTVELMNLVKVGPVEIGFWPDFILVSGISGKFKGLIPTVAA